jgi:hypothetical protein
LLILLSQILFLFKIGFFVDKLLSLRGNFTRI